MSRNNQGSKWLRPVKRLAIYLRDGFKCVYCERDLTNVKSEFITLDHVKPRSKGGSNEASNLVTCCLDCNISKSDKSLYWWLRDWVLTLRHIEKIKTRVRRHTRRSLTKYLKLAKDLMEL